MDKIYKMCYSTESNFGRKENKMSPLTNALYKVNEWLLAAIILSAMFHLLCINPPTVPLGIW